MDRKLKSRPPVTIGSWDFDRVIHDGDTYFEELISAIDRAGHSLMVEFYIFADDHIGNRVFSALERAFHRGVRVRLMVDGIGSAGWARRWAERARELGMPFKVYNELPWEFLFFGRRIGPRRQRLWALLQRINNRNHRKICIVDRETAFVGSMNVSDAHLPSISGENAWRDTGAIVRGLEVATLVDGFERVWVGRLRALRQRLRRKGRKPQSSTLVRLNLRANQRQQNYIDLLVRIVRAKNRIWITNAYFVPESSLLKVLASAAQRGVDVRILVPGRSDVFFIPWVASALQVGLLNAGVKVFEYKRAVLHAKTLIIDDWAIVGSSNLNHRSLLHDLEADVVISGRESRLSLEAQFNLDLGYSEQISPESWRRRPLLERIAGRVLLAFRYVL